MEGEFTSPNYPGYYPLKAVCNYLFYGSKKQKVEITLANFDVGERYV